MALRPHSPWLNLEKTLLSTVSTLPPLLKMAPPKVPPSSLTSVYMQFVIVSDVPLSLVDRTAIARTLVTISDRQ